MLELALLELEDKVKALAEELATIRKYVVRLEEDNRALQSIVHKKNTAVSGEANLRALFDAGFHICPSHFGESREDECIFCSSFLSNAEAGEGSLPNKDDNEGK
ncbi:MAG: initiation control protein YabA [Bacillota bacterium]|nr:initiation control protein YabA [Bacillota bacterium]